MLTPAQRVTQAIFGAGVVSLIGLGCGDNPTRQADKQIRADLAVAYKNSPVLQTSLEETARSSTASPGLRASAKSALAHAEAQQAAMARAELDAKHLQAARLLYEISDLTSRVEMGTTFANGYLKQDPAKSVSAIKTLVDQAQGKGNAEAWVEIDGKSLPTLSAVTQKISSLNGEITKGEDELARLNDEKRSAVDASEAGFIEADKQTGKESLDTFNTASSQRKTAAELQIKIDQTEASLVPLRQDLAVAEVQKGVLEGAIASLNERVSGIGKDWQTIQDHAKAQDTMSGTLVEGSGSINAKAAELATISKEADVLAEKIANDLRNAATHFSEAVTAADALRREVEEMKNALTDKTTKTAKALDATKAIFDAGSFRLNEAYAQIDLAGLLADRARLLAVKKRVADEVASALDAASLKVPAELDDANLGETLRAASEAADTQHSVADKAVQNVIEMPLAAQDRKDAALIADLLLFHGWSHLALNTGGADGASTASAKLKEAIEIRKKLTTPLKIILPADIAPELEALPSTVPSPTPGANPSPAGDSPTIEPSTQGSELLGS